MPGNGRATDYLVGLTLLLNFKATIFLFLKMTTEKSHETMPKAANEDSVSFHAEMVSKHDTHNAELTESPFGHHESSEWRTAEKRIVRKLDMTLLPIVWILYMFNYLDRNNIAQVLLSSQTQSIMYSSLTHTALQASTSRQTRRGHRTRW